MKKVYIIMLLVISVSCTKEITSSYQVISKVPDLTIPENKLKFKAIENYKIVVTHFRTDKK